MAQAESLPRAPVTSPATTGGFRRHLRATVRRQVGNALGIATALLLKVAGGAHGRPEGGSRSTRGCERRRSGTAIRAGARLSATRRVGAALSPLIILIVLVGLAGPAPAQLLPPLGGGENPIGGLLGPLEGALQGLSPVSDRERPRVTSAGSSGNTRVVVQFSESMADNATNPANYSIVQENVNPEVGTIPVWAASFATQDRLSVALTTASQNEVTYRVRVSNVTDRAGNPLADPETSNGVMVDPTSATFAGTPPTDGERVDTDGDGLFDHEESYGWVVTVHLGNGEVTTRQVSSNLTSEDSDVDGLSDFVEKSLTIDPRDDDTDDDGLSDAVEFNEIYSDPTIQDSDADTLTDGLEVTFFRTSAILADTDGDQIADGTEVSLANRNPKLADLPRPTLELGEMHLALDVRFLESFATETTTETRELESKTATATMTQSERKEYSNTDTRTLEAGTKLTEEVKFELTAKAGGFDSGGETKASFKTTAEQSFASAFTSTFTETSSLEATRSYEDSLTHEAETTAGTTEGSNVTRELRGARASAAVLLKNAGDIAFTIRNLQLTALIQDPQDPTKFTPVATLLPESGPDASFNLGPLVPERGPIVFSNDQVFPKLIEDLLRNPRGLVFRFSNYDIVDELDRDFAFTSQDINDRTAGLVIDYGGFDSDRDGQGDFSEVKRVATGIGRPVADTNGDQTVSDGDRNVVFDENGKHTGITLRQALAASGLTEYNELETPTSGLTQAEIDSSYSVRPYDDGTGELVFRVRGTKREPGINKSWEIVTPTGIDRTLHLDDHVLMPGSSVTLAFVQDLDRDGMPALVEFLNGCADGTVDADGDGLFDTADTDRDGLDDRFEVMIGWKVDTERGSRQTHSRCSTEDTDRDGLLDGEEAPGVVQRDEAGLILFGTNQEPKRDTSTTSDAFLVTLADPITDPTSKDTDLDGLHDKFELTPYKVPLLLPPDDDPPCAFTDTDGPPYETQPLQTSPERFDSDDDTASDGVEKNVGGNPRCHDFDNFGDRDGDGLVNAQEDHPFEITVYGVRARTSTVSELCDSVCPELSVPGQPEKRMVVSNKDDADSDDDGLTDLEEFSLGSDPSVSDTDDDGVSDSEEVRGFALGDRTMVTTNPTDADTDNDKRSDGEEAGRAGRLIVRVPGKAPYEASSDPNDPDSDFDQLVDGDEHTAGSDPSKDNTDGDSRPDYSEVKLGRRPLVPDLFVTMNFVKVVIDQNGEGNDDDSSGEFAFGLGVLKPGGHHQHIVYNGEGPINQFGAWGILGLPVCANDSETQCHERPSEYIQLGAGQTLSLQNRGATIGSVSTTDDLFEQFGIKGFFAEMDGQDIFDCRQDFPEPFGNDPGGGQSGNDTIAGKELKPGSHGLILTRKPPCLENTDGDELQFRLFVSYVAQ